MDQENLSRSQKIEMARKMAGSSAESQEEEGHFFLRILLSAFILLAVMGMTKFEAMGEEKAQEYQTKVTGALKAQRGLDAIKEIIASVG